MTPCRMYIFLKHFWYRFHNSFIFWVLEWFTDLESFFSIPLLFWKIYWFIITDYLRVVNRFPKYFWPYFHFGLLHKFSTRIFISFSAIRMLKISHFKNFTTWAVANFLGNMFPTGQPLLTRDPFLRLEINFWPGFHYKMRLSPSKILICFL